MPRALVTTGTTQFQGLLRAADDLALKQPAWEFLFQVGHTPFRPRGGECFTFSDRIEDEFRSADLVISHAGAGTMFTLARERIRAIVVPNLERADHHQTELAGYFESKSYCLMSRTLEDLEELFERQADFTPHPFDEKPFDTASFIADMNLEAAESLHILATEGGHVAQARLLAAGLRDEGLAADIRIFSDAEGENFNPLPHFSGKESSPLARIVPLFRGALGSESRRMNQDAASGDVLIALGAGGCLPAALFGRLRGRKLIVLESRSRVWGQSWTYRLLAPFAQHNLRQFPLPNSICYGVLF